MLNNDALLISPFLQRRTRAVSFWLARSRVTASDVMKAMMGRGRVTIHSASDGNVLFSLDWNGPLVVVKGDGLDSPYCFHDMKSAITFFDAVLLDYAVGSSVRRSTVSNFLEFGTP